jgi:hypothetical protein
MLLERQHLLGSSLDLSAARLSSWTPFVLPNVSFPAHKTEELDQVGLTGVPLGTEVGS